MRLITAVALAAVMLWVPVDGVAQTEAQRRLAESYETRARQIEALINPAADQAARDALLSSCVARAIAAAGRPGGIGVGMAECTDRMTELGNQQAARRMSLEREAFQIRQQGLDILARASTNPTQRRPPVTASAGATVACSKSAEELESLRSYSEQGFAGAQAELGSMHGNGDCVPQDYAEAVRWTRLAAEQGDAEAQSGLGYAYKNGYGVPEDDAEAVRWYRLAAEQGDAEAIRGPRSQWVLTTRWGSLRAEMPMPGAIITAVNWATAQRRIARLRGW